MACLPVYASTVIESQIQGTEIQASRRTPDEPEITVYLDQQKCQIMARSNPNRTPRKPPPPPKTLPMSRSTRSQIKTPTAPKSRNKSSSAPIASGPTTPTPRTRGRPKVQKPPVIKQESPESPQGLQSIPQAAVKKEDESEDEIPAHLPPATRPAMAPAHRRAPRPATKPRRPRQRPAPHRAVHNVRTRATRRRLHEEGRPIRLVELDDRGNEIAQRR